MGIDNIDRDMDKSYPCKCSGRRIPEPINPLKFVP